MTALRARPEVPIQGRAAFDFIRYGSVWEDADVLCNALAPVAKGGRLLSIASAGDNVLALLTLDPAEVVAVDLSASQLACLAIRISAFRMFDDDVLLAFLGITACSTRLRQYRVLREDLPGFARGFWDERPELVARGVVHAGKFEAYFRAFRRRVLPMIHRRRQVVALLQPRSRDGRDAFYADEWDGWRWRLLFRLFFSRVIMGRFGRDPAFFKHVRGPVGSRILERTRYALTALPTHTNPYLRCIMTGEYGPESLPRYLRPEHRATIRRRLDRLRVHHGPVDDCGGTFDGFNLSDIFEYMSPAEHEGCYAALVDQASSGARLVYWNLLTRRAAPTRLAGQVRPLDAQARALHEQDRAWFYQSLHIDEVAGDG